MPPSFVFSANFFVGKAEGSVIMGNTGTVNINAAPEDVLPLVGHFVTRVSFPAIYPGGWKREILETTSQYRLCLVHNHPRGVLQDAENFLLIHRDPNAGWLAGSGQLLDTKLCTGL